jgi:PEP-CTERM motif
VKLFTVLSIALIGAGSLEASIVAISSQASPLNYQVGAFSQNFATAPTVTTGTTTLYGANSTIITATGTTGPETITLEAAGSSSLYYDPNGTGTLTGVAGPGNSVCNIGNQTGGQWGSLTGMAGCVGNYSLPTQYNSTSSQNNVTTTQKTYAPATPNQITYSILFAVPVYGVSFYLTTPNNVNTGQVNTDVDVYDQEGNLLTGSTPQTNSNGTPVSAAINTYLGFNSYETVYSSTVPFTTITLTEDPTVTLTGPSYNSIVSNISGSIDPVPEPGTLGLIGLGVAGLTYFARRRKA